MYLFIYRIYLLRERERKFLNIINEKMLYNALEIFYCIFYYAVWLLFIHWTKFSEWLCSWNISKMTCFRTHVWHGSRQWPVRNGWQGPTSNPPPRVSAPRTWAHVSNNVPHAVIQLHVMLSSKNYPWYQTVVDIEVNIIKEGRNANLFFSVCRSNELSVLRGQFLEFCI